MKPTKRTKETMVPIEFESSVEFKIENTLAAIRTAYPYMLKKLCLRFRHYGKYSRLPYDFKRDLRYIADNAVLTALNKDHSIDHPWKKAARRQLYFTELRILEMFKKGHPERDLRYYEMPKYYWTDLYLLPSDLKFTKGAMESALLTSVGFIYFPMPILFPANDMVSALRISKLYIRDGWYGGRSWVLKYREGFHEVDDDVDAKRFSDEEDD